MDLEPKSTTEAPFFGSQLVLVNVGIRPFFDTLKEAGVEIYQVDWSIPAGGDQDLLRVLDLLLD